jgi:hypothetical protein
MFSARGTSWYGTLMGFSNNLEHLKFLNNAYLTPFRSESNPQIFETEVFDVSTTEEKYDLHFRKKIDFDPISLDGKIINFDNTNLKFVKIKDKKKKEHEINNFIVRKTNYFLMINYKYNSGLDGYAWYDVLVVSEEPDLLDSLFEYTNQFYQWQVDKENAVMFKLWKFDFEIDKLYLEGLANGAQDPW